MGFNSVVCIKQVPDTENLTSEAMKEDGTVNRTALPAIVNPEDLNALEMAIELKEQHGGHVTALTMGPPSAADALRDALYRGADRAILLTDRKFAASDTLATSYALSQAICNISDTDVVFCGRQAIDGDTAQIGPQLADKLGLPQYTYAEKILEASSDKMKIERNLGKGHEIVEGPLPALLTVTETANTPRFPAAKRLLKFRHARTGTELEKEDGGDPEEYAKEGLLIEEWNASDVGCDPERCGGSGSPTKVKKIESVQLVSEEHVEVEPTSEGMNELVQELIEEHIIE